MSQRRLEALMPFLVSIGLLVVWQEAVDIFHIVPFVLPSPRAIVAAFLEFRGTIMSAAWFTLLNTLGGFALGIVVGILLGSAIGVSRLAYAGLYPVLIGFNSVPKVAITPILVLWMGIGQPPAITTAFLLCFFPSR